MEGQRATMGTKERPRKTKTMGGIPMGIATRLLQMVYTITGERTGLCTTR